MILLNSVTKRPILLIFRYFFVALFVLSCKSDASKDKEATQSTETTVEESTDTTAQTKTILFFGDSLTAGLGLEDSNDAYPALVQAKIDSLGLNYVVVNSGVSGETTAGGLGRIDWVLNQQVDIFVLELGANDGLRGVTLSETRDNLQHIVDKVIQRYPEVQIIMAGMQLPPNLGPDYTNEFRSLFNDIATDNDLELIPFLLEGVGGVPELNLEDGIHPNEEGQKIVAQNVWDILEPMIMQNR